jgi:hypothetical protein
MDEDIPEDFQLSPSDEVELVDGGDLGNMFLVRVDGELKRKAKTNKNVLLYKHGLYSLLREDGKRTILSQEDPYIAIEPTNNDDVYALWHGLHNHPVMTPPSKSEKVLEGVITSIEYGDHTKLSQVYQYVLDNQVRRNIMSHLINEFPVNVVETSEGWQVDGMFLVTWETNIYLAADDLDEDTYIVSGGVSRTDERKEFITLTPEREPEPRELTIDGSEYTLGELEMLFLAKVKYLLDFREHLNDDALYRVIKRYVSDTFENTPSRD